MNKCSQTNYALHQQPDIADSPTKFGFKIVSSQMVDLWTPGANYGLMRDRRVLLEAHVDPLIIATVFGIPSSSSETIDLLIQMFEFPLTTVEALIFGALAAISCEHSNESRAYLLKEWGQMTNQRKMEKGFQLLSPVMGHSSGDSEPHYNELQNEFYEVIGIRGRIHEEFSEMLGYDVMGGSHGLLEADLRFSIGR